MLSKDLFNFSRFERIDIFKITKTKTSKIKMGKREKKEILPMVEIKYK